MPFNPFSPIPPKIVAAPSSPSHDTTVTEMTAIADKICRALGIDVDAIERRASDRDTVAPSVRGSLQRGNMIEAIKHYREWKDCGLREAKEAVEAIVAGGHVDADSQLELLKVKLDAILARVESER